jgi:hypothetical protein
MARESLIITLPSGLKAELYKSITYGEHLAIQKILFENADFSTGEDGKPQVKSSGGLTLQFQRKKMTTVVKEFQNALNEIFPCTDEQLDSLAIEDGLALEKEVEKILESQKKTLKK